MAPPRYDAAGDPPLGLPVPVELQVPFTFDATFARRLARREVNPKEAFTLYDGAGAWFRASVTRLSDIDGEALPYERLSRSPEPGVEITLACAVLARQRMIFVVQKATELGVTRVVPLLTDFSVQADGLDHEKAHAWPGQITRAVRQCRRSSMPELSPPTPLPDFMASPTISNADLCLFMDERGTGTGVEGRENPRRLVLFVGPEGGFSDRERGGLSGKAIPLVLGGRVLRAETAVLAGLTAVHLTWGDFRSRFT